MPCNIPQNPYLYSRILTERENRGLRDLVSSHPRCRQGCVDTPHNNNGRRPFLLELGPETSPKFTLYLPFPTHPDFRLRIAPTIRRGCHPYMEKLDRRRAQVRHGPAIGCTVSGPVIGLRLNLRVKVLCHDKITKTNRKA